MKKIFAIAMLVSTIFLVGCVNADVTVDLETDGTGKAIIQLLGPDLVFDNIPNSFVEDLGKNYESVEKLKENDQTGYKFTTKNGPIQDVLKDIVRIENLNEAADDNNSDNGSTKADSEPDNSTKKTDSKLNNIIDKIQGKSDNSSTKTDSESDNSTEKNDSKLNSIIKKIQGKSDNSSTKNDSKSDNSSTKTDNESDNNTEKNDSDSNNSTAKTDNKSENTDTTDEESNNKLMELLAEELYKKYVNFEEDKSFLTTTYSIDLKLRDAIYSRMNLEQKAVTTLLGNSTGIGLHLKSPIKAQANNATSVVKEDGKHVYNWDYTLSNVENINFVLKVPNVKNIAIVVGIILLLIIILFIIIRSKINRKNKTKRELRELKNREKLNKSSNIEELEKFEDEF